MSEYWYQLVPGHSNACSVLSLILGVVFCNLLWELSGGQPTSAYVQPSRGLGPLQRAPRARASDEGSTGYRYTPSVPSSGQPSVVCVVLGERTGGVRVLRVSLSGCREGTTSNLGSFNVPATPAEGAELTERSHASCNPSGGAIMHHHPWIAGHFAQVLPFATRL